MAQRTFVIANPRSRNGATGRLWRELEAKLRGALGPVEVWHTQAPRDAEQLASRAVGEGAERILVAGGDGTLSEVATGLIDAGLADRVELGVLPLGTGGDFLRSLGAPRDLDAALATVASGQARPVDAGRVHFRDDSGGERSACFLNVASFGISALTDELVNRTTKAFGGTVSFLIGTVRAIVRYRSEVVRVRVDGELVFEGPVVLAAAANGRTFGGGMQVAPQARIDDGLLDVVIVRAVPPTELLRKLPMIYRGTHLADPAVCFRRGRVVEAETVDGSLGLELDGEPLGSLPARWELLPGALRMLGPAA